jgi:hypothetical protein
VVLACLNIQIVNWVERLVASQQTIGL